MKFDSDTFDSDKIVTLPRDWAVMEYVWPLLFEWFLITQSPTTLVLVCRQFQDAIYKHFDGPPDDLNWLKGECLGMPFYNFPNEACLSVFTSIQERIIQRDYAFLNRIFTRNANYAKLAIGVGCSFQIKKQGFCRMTSLFCKLIESNDLETFCRLARSLPVASEDGVFIVDGVNQQTGKDYQWFRILLTIAFEQGLPVERSGCTACRRVPGHHRGWTLRAIIAHDDIELLELYVNQHLKINKQAGGYVLYDHVICKIWLTDTFPHKIAQFWAASGRAALLTFELRYQIALRSTPVQLEFALEHGVDLNDIRLLRAAMRRKHPVALLNAYDWKLCKQDYKHMCHKIAQWPASEIEAVNPIWKVK